MEKGVPKKYCRKLAILLLLVGNFVMSGCVGGKVPAEKVLRISPATVAHGTVIHPDDKLIVLQTLEAFPALERSAVMMANGNVLTPSTRWFWEGAPASMITASLASGLQDMKRIAIIWPDRSRIRHSAILNGRVEAFEVQRAPEKKMVVRLRLSLWGERGRSLMATYGAGAEVPISSVSDKAIAAAAVTAMEEVNKQVRHWLTNDCNDLLY